MKFYTKPEIEISVFATEDIITTSIVDDSNTPSTTSLINKGALPDSASGSISFDDIIS